MIRNISMLMSAGIAAFAACSSSTDNDVKVVNLPNGSIGRLDTQTVRSLDYTLREDNLDTVVDTKFTAQFGKGAVTLPLEPFYGPVVAGQFGTWQVDGAGHVTHIPGASTPGFVARLESMPNGPLTMGQEWELISPSDSEAMQSPDIVLQRKTRYRVTQAVTLANGNLAVRIDVDGWNRVIKNSAAIAFSTESGVGALLDEWTPSTKGLIDIDISHGVLLGMRMSDQLFSDVSTPDELVGVAGQTTYCINPSSGFTPRSDICGWSL
ncbi:MAG: hypothetical protein H0T46_29040 [Deltaproteobacteria bacterium]|nr:hypothetical protein [Deltaproteobacteria bacterium]